MGSIVAHDQWSTDADLDATRQRLVASFVAVGARTLTGPGPDLDLEVGNEGRLRLRGASFTVIEDLPLSIRIALEASRGGTVVRVHQCDPFDDELSTDLRSKYQLAMTHWAQRARAALAGPSAVASTV